MAQSVSHQACVGRAHKGLRVRIHLLRHLTGTYAVWQAVPSCHFGVRVHAGNVVQQPRGQNLPDDALMRRRRWRQGRKGGQGTGVSGLATVGNDEELGTQLRGFLQCLRVQVR